MRIPMRYTAILDFGNLRLDDPAIDLKIAWNTFGKKTRQLYREILQVEEAVWLRGRAFAKAQALQALPYYQHTFPEIIKRANFTISEIMAYEH